MKRFVLASVLLLSLGQLARAQEGKQLKAEWLAQDVEGVGLIARVMPVESQTFEAIAGILAVKWSPEDDDAGFGGRRFKLQKPGGYTHFYVDAFTFNGSFAYYEVGVSGNYDSWPLVREPIIQKWRQSGGPDFEETEYGLRFRVRHDWVFQAYREAVGAELGGAKPADVPAGLREDYEYLTSPLVNSSVSRGACGYGGSVPEGKLAIDALVKARRVDLIENVLRGLNPGGRVYAALALLEMKKRGAKLSQETQAAIDKIAGMKTRIFTCDGCIVTMRTAGEILRSPDDF